MAGELSVVELAQSQSHRVAFITCPSQESAEAIAESLVSSQAAACVNIVPGVRSVYRWQGEICRDQEVLLVVKSTAAKAEEVASCLAKHHPYTEPELIFLPILEGSSTYLDWVTQETRSSARSLTGNPPVV